MDIWFGHTNKNTWSIFSKMLDIWLRLRDLDMLYVYTHMLYSNPRTWLRSFFEEIEDIYLKEFKRKKKAHELSQLKWNERIFGA